MLCVGLADGRLVRFTQAMIQADSAQGELVDLGNRNAPIKAMKKFRKDLLVCIGPELVFIKLHNWTIKKAWETFPKKYALSTS